MNVANNQLTGDIPGDLFLRGVGMIDVSQNMFSSINKGKPWSGTAKIRNPSFVSLSGNRNLSINFTSFIQLLSKTDYDSSPSILNLSFCDIKSPLLANIYYMESLLTCDLRGNKFYSTLPDYLGDFSFLSYLDVSLNNLTGKLPTGIQNLVSLHYLDISGNPFMRDETSASSNVFNPDFLRMIRLPQENFTCPEGRLTFTNGRIRVDPTFYEFKYCVFDDGFYGDNGLCKECMEDARCRKHAINGLADLRPNIMVVPKGYWPSPDPGNATHLVKGPVPPACSPSDS